MRRLKTKAQEQATITRMEYPVGMTAQDELFFTASIVEISCSILLWRICQEMADGVVKD